MSGEDKKINIFDIERFAIHDGPGIRTTVFFKGCPLRCEWCANPESQSYGSELMHLQKKCSACGRCAAACPNGAITAINGGAPFFTRENCKLCGECTRACPNGALRVAGAMMEAGEIIEVILRDRSYYEHSGGGVTISGGEPFAQYGGLIRLIKACGDEGLHTALETCADTDTAQFAEAFGLIDICLFDLKHHDSERLYAATRGNLGRILENLDYAAEHGPRKTVIRVPVIPEFNFNGDDMESIFRAALKRGIKRVDLLPYHTLGSGKYAAIGKKEPLDGVKMLKREDLEPFREKGGKMGLKVKIGA